MLYSVLGISKQSVHKMLDRSSRRLDERMLVIHMVNEVRKDHPSMGCRDIYFKLKPEFIGRDAFEKLCKEAGLQSRKSKDPKRTTDSSGVKRFENLKVNTIADGLDKIWSSDITYFEVKGRFYYLTFFLDEFSRRIVGHSVSKRLSTEETSTPALEMALRTRGDKDFKGLIIHTDGGGQYYAREFLKLTARYGIRNSMCIYPWENGKAERINGVIKNNYLKYKKIETYEDLKREVDHAVQMYNYGKPHCELKRQTPVEFEEKLIFLQQQTS